MNARAGGFEAGIIALQDWIRFDPAMISVSVSSDIRRLDYISWGMYTVGMALE